MGGKIRIHYVTDNLFLFPSFITILFSRFGAILKFSFVCSWGPIVSWKTVCWKLLYQTGQIFSRSEGCDIFFGGGSRVHKRADMLLSCPTPPPPPPSSFTSLSAAVCTAPLSHLFDTVHSIQDWFIAHCIDIDIVIHNWQSSALQCSPDILLHSTVFRDSRGAAAKCRTW